MFTRELLGYYTFGELESLSGWFSSPYLTPPVGKIMLGCFRGVRDGAETLAHETHCFCRAISRIRSAGLVDPCQRFHFPWPVRYSLSSRDRPSRINCITPAKHNEKKGQLTASKQ